MKKKTLSVAAAALAAVMLPLAVVRPHLLWHRLLPPPLEDRCQATREA